MSEQEDLLSRFVRGTATESETAEVEDRLLSDEEFYERVLVAERDLIDAYVRGDLTTGERARFVERYLSTDQQRERVNFARGLVEAATLAHETGHAGPLNSPEGPNATTRRQGFLASLFARGPAVGFALAAAGLALVVVGWLVVERLRARVEPQQARVEVGAPPNTKSPESDASKQSESAAQSPGVLRNATPTTARTPELAPEPRPARTSLATVTLTPGSLRDGGSAATLLVPDGATHMRLRLELEADDYDKYQAVVSTPEGKKVWTGSARKDRPVDARSVTLALPAPSLEPGDYIVELSGSRAGARSAPAAQYSFHVSRKR